MTARVRSPRSAGRQVAIEADARTLAVFAVGPQLTEIAATVPAAADRTGLILSLHVLDPPEGRDARGIFVDRLTISPLTRARPPTRALWAAGLAGALLGAVLALCRLTWPGIVAGGMAVGLAQALPLTFGLGPFTWMPATTLAVDATLIAVVAVAATARRLAGAPPWSSATIGALVVSGVAAHLTLLLVLHPGVTNGDATFHVHRFGQTLGGGWLFTSSGPGGDFPYPVGLYVVAMPLLRLFPDPAALLRVAVVVVTWAAGLLLHAAAARHWTARAGLIAVVLYYAVPQNLHVQTTAFLTNAFGNALAAGSLAALALAASREPALHRRRMAGSGWLAVAAALALGALLSHVSAGVIVFATLAACAVALFAADSGHRWLAAALVVSLALVAGTAWGVYYRHFGETYRALATRSAPAPDPPAPAAPMMRAEAHQTRYVPGTAALRARAAAVPRYLLRYYGAAALTLAAVGLVYAARRWRADPLTTIALVWTVTCSGFLALGVGSPIDLRYYLAGFPVVALLGGLAATEWWPRGGVRRLLSALLVIGAAVQGGWTWWRWLNTPDF